MPPRDGASLVAAEDGAPRDALTVLPLALPLPLTTRIWGALPYDVRLRCREVCPAWRDALAEPRAWTELDFTAACGFAARVTPALLRAATARAGGRLERLYVPYDRELQPALLELCAANADTLRLLRLERPPPFRYVTHAVCEALLRAAPRHCALEADVDDRYVLAASLLRNASPFQAVRLRALSVNCAPGMDVALFASELPAHPSLRELTLRIVHTFSATSYPLDTFAALDAVVDTALTLRLTRLRLVDCGVGPASAVALPRLLRGAALRELIVHSAGGALMDKHAAALFADAMRSNCTLTSLTLYGAGLFHDVDAAATVVGALVGHASLMSIRLTYNTDGNAAAAVGVLLSALVAADTPQLRVLDISTNRLGDAGMGALVDALLHNTHLRELLCYSNAMSATFARERLMPALAANTSLQKLDSDSIEANEFIAARTKAMSAAARD